MKEYKRTKEKMIEVDFEGEGLTPVSLEAIKNGAIIIVFPPEKKEGDDENPDS